MWNNEDWAAFVAAVEPHGWSAYVDSDGQRSTGGLSHVDGAIVHVESHAGKLVTDYATASNGTSRITIGEWDRTAKRWAEGPGAVRLAAYAERRRREARESDMRSAVNVRAESLAAYADARGLTPGVRPATISGYAIVDFGALRVTLYTSGSVCCEARPYGTPPRELAAQLVALADWMDSEGSK